MGVCNKVAFMYYGFKFIRIHTDKFSKFFIEKNKIKDLNSKRKSVIKKFEKIKTILNFILIIKYCVSKHTIYIIWMNLTHLIKQST